MRALRNLLAKVHDWSRLWRRIVAQTLIASVWPIHCKAEPEISLEKSSERWSLVRGLFSNLSVLVALLLIGPAGCTRPRFVVLAASNQYVLLDRETGLKCWSGPENDLDAFMQGEPVMQSYPRPAGLPLCKDLRQEVELSNTYSADSTKR